MNKRKGQPLPLMEGGPSSKAEIMIVACLKDAFPSEKEAKQVNPGWRSYRCPLCSKWHLTHTKQRSRRRTYA